MPQAPNLFHWRRDVEADVRIVMRHAGLTDLSVGACKRWVREFIQQRIPWWSPGKGLKWMEYQMIGADFERHLFVAKRERDKLSWQDRVNTTPGRRK